MPLTSTNTCTVLFVSPAPLVPLKVSEPALVMLSVLLEPVSLPAARSGVPGVAGATLTVMVRVTVDMPSLTCTTKLSVPAKPAEGV